MGNEIMVSKVMSWLFGDADVEFFEESVIDILTEAYNRPLKEILIDYINDKIKMLQDWEDEDVLDTIQEGQALIKEIRS